MELAGSPAVQSFSSQRPPTCDRRSSSAKSKSINYLNKGSRRGTSLKKYTKRFSKPAGEGAI